MNRGPSVVLVWILPLFLLRVLPAWAGQVRSGLEAQNVVRATLTGRTPALTVANVREAGDRYEVEVVTSNRYAEFHGFSRG